MRLPPLTYVLEGRDPVRVELRLGDLTAWEREHDRTAAELVEAGRHADLAWLAWHGARTRKLDPRAQQPYAAWELELVDLEVEETEHATPTPEGPPDA